MPGRERRSDRDAALRIITKLKDAGFLAYLAGGCVRDELFGVTPKDHDVATSAHPDDIEEVFAKTAAVGASFGVMLVRDFGPTVEVATFRSDGPYSDARRPDSVVFSSPELDAHRRDFTINAIFIDPLAPEQERIIDHVNGLEDISSRTLRAVGNPDDRLGEDHLRALRGVRFAARYDLRIDERTSAAIREHASELSGVSVERIGEEIRKMMSHTSRARAAELIRELGLDDAVFSHADPVFESESVSDLHTLRSLDPDADSTTALAAWAIDRHGERPMSEPSKTAHAWKRALDLSNEHSDAMRDTLAITHGIIHTWDTMRVSDKKRLAASERAGAALMLTRATNQEAASRYELDRDALASDGIGLAPEPFIGGEDLIAMGLNPGPRFGKIISAVYDAQLEGRVTSKRDASDAARQAHDSGD